MDSKELEELKVRVNRLEQEILQQSQILKLANKSLKALKKENKFLRTRIDGMYVYMFSKEQE